LSQADADDAAQHVFILAEGKLDQIERGKERTFLYGTAVRVAANARRARLNRREVPESALAPPVSVSPLPDQLLELERARSLLDELLSEVPDELRRVLVLADMEQHTMASIAELEAIPAGTAASRLRRARALFRELLAREQHRNPFGGGPP
jgi:RNA polymerase sigma-70 factor (ECF subfamily)